MHASSPSRAELGQQFPPPPSSPKEKSNEEWNGSSSDSNTKATAAGISASPRTIPPFVIIGAWIALSSAVILYNREIMMGSANFRFPLCLTTLHLAFQTLATRLLHRYTNLIAGANTAEYAPLPTTDNESNVDEKAQRAEHERRAKAASVEISWDDWRRQLVPPAIMFSLSLILSNWAYLYLTTAFIHMLKSCSPVAILCAAFIFRTKAFSLKAVLIMLVISFGVGLASYGETSFNLTGFLIQFTAIAIEATRVTLIQILLAGKDMSPLKSLYYFAPICLVFNAALILPVEGFAALRAIPALGFFTILSNCTLTMMLNLSAIYLIGLSAMVLSLSKVVKDIMLVAGSAILLGDKLTSLQAVGYLIATAGLIIYKMSPS